MTPLLGAVHTPHADVRLKSLMVICISTFPPVPAQPVLQTSPWHKVPRCARHARRAHSSSPRFRAQMPVPDIARIPVPDVFIYKNKLLPEFRQTPIASSLTYPLRSPTLLLLEPSREIDRRHACRYFFFFSRTCSLGFTASVRDKGLRWLVQRSPGITVFKTIANHGTLE